MLTIGTRVRFKNPQSADEARERFTVLELRGDRVLVEAVTEMTIAPTFVYLVADLVPEPTLEIGTRVRLKHDVDRFPHFIAPAGSVGAVLELDPIGGVWIEMVELIPGCEEWNNAIVWESPNEALLDVEVL